MEPRLTVSKMHHCGVPFIGSEVIRLYASESGKKMGFAFQDLIIGICQGTCGKPKLFWQGVYQNGTYDPNFYRIKQQDEREWLARKEATLTAPLDGYDPKGVDCVWGSAHIKPYNKRLVRVY